MEPAVADVAVRPHLGFLQVQLVDPIGTRVRGGNCLCGHGSAHTLRVIKVIFG